MTKISFHHFQHCHHCTTGLERCIRSLPRQEKTVWTFVHHLQACQCVLCKVKTRCDWTFQKKVTKLPLVSIKGWSLFRKEFAENNLVTSAETSSSS